MKNAVEIAGVVVAAIGIVLAWLARHPTKKEEERDEERLEREREEAERKRQAELVVDLEDSRHRPFGIRELTFRIRNLGEAAARQVYLQLRDGNGKVVSCVEDDADQRVLTLAPGQISAPVTRLLEYVNDPMGQVALPTGLTSHVIWRDDSGLREHEAPLLVSLDDIR